MRTYEQCENDMTYRHIKQDTIETINLYVTHGLPPGSFVSAVLANDLMGAFSKADEKNMIAMLPIVTYIYNEIPGNCHGSYERVKQWIDDGGINGRDKATKD